MAAALIPTRIVSRFDAQFFLADFDNCSFLLDCTSTIVALWWARFSGSAHTFLALADTLSDCSSNDSDMVLQVMLCFLSHNRMVWALTLANLAASRWLNPCSRHCSSQSFDL